MKRPCIVCGVPTTKSRCPRCTPKQIKASRHERGLGADHVRIRRQVLEEEDTCWRCHLPGTPTDPLVGGHVRDRALGGSNDRENYRAEHRSCNASAGGKAGAARRWPR